MKSFDVYLQNQRISKALQYIRKPSKVIDIGAYDGKLFEALGDNLIKGYGIEPLIKEKVQTKNYTIYPGFFPLDFPEDIQVDAITMLAVLEHIPMDKQKALSEACWKYLKTGGLLIITVPGPQVDYILSVLSFLKIIDGMSLDEHYGFKVKDTLSIFSKPHFELVAWKKFQLGVNNLFVFRKL